MSDYKIRVRWNDYIWGTWVSREECTQTVTLLAYLENARVLPDESNPIIISKNKIKLIPPVLFFGRPDLSMGTIQAALVIEKDTHYHLTCLTLDDDDGIEDAIDSLGQDIAETLLDHATDIKHLIQLVEAVTL